MHNWSPRDVVIPDFVVCAIGPLVLRKSLDRINRSTLDYINYIDCSWEYTSKCELCYRYKVCLFITLVNVNSWFKSEALWELFEIDHARAVVILILRPLTRCNPDWSSQECLSYARRSGDSTNGCTRAWCGLRYVRNIALAAEGPMARSSHTPCLSNDRCIITTCLPEASSQIEDSKVYKLNLLVVTQESQYADAVRPGALAGNTKLRELRSELCSRELVQMSFCVYLFPQLPIRGHSCIITSYTQYDSYM